MSFRHSSLDNNEFCEICGRNKSESVITIGLSSFNVCKNCSKYGGASTDRTKKERNNLFNNSSKNELITEKRGGLSSPQKVSSKLPMRLFSISFSL
ncbi:MAG: hypothetical protein ACFFD1_06060, partial [Candidatus Thorarchaeota archaeon]